METKLPREIQVFDLWPASIRFVLPRRDLGQGKFVGWLLLLLGIVAMAGAIYLGLVIAGQATWVLGKFLRGAAFILSLTTVGGLVPLWWGLAALFGHREIEIRGDSIRTMEKVGPFWRSKRWKLGKITKFDVVDPSAESDKTVPGFLKQFYALLVRLQEGKQGMLAWGYAPEFLRPLADELTDRANKALERAGQPASIGQPRKVAGEDDTDFDDEDWDEVDDEDSDGWSEAAGATPEGLEPALTQPAGSQIAVDKFEGGLTLRVPPAGLWKGTSGLFFFALLWNGFMTIFTSIIILAVVQGGGGDFKDSPWMVVLFLGLFWAVGVGLLLGSLNMGRRQAMFAVAAGKLLVMQRGIFGAKQREFPCEDISDICLGPSGMEVNGTPVRQLQIHARDGQQLGLLTGRDETELEWLACELRLAWRTATSKGQPHAPALKPPEAKT